MVDHFKLDMDKSHNVWEFQKILFVGRLSNRKNAFELKYKFIIATFW